MPKEVTVKFDGNVLVGKVILPDPMTGDEGKDRLMIAATCWNVLQGHATFEVDGETFTAQDCREWFA